MKGKTAKKVNTTRRDFRDDPEIPGGDRRLFEGEARERQRERDKRVHEPTGMKIGDWEWVVVITQWIKPEGRFFLVLFALFSEALCCLLQCLSFFSLFRSIDHQPVLPHHYCLVFPVGVGKHSVSVVAERGIGLGPGALKVTHSHEDLALGRLQQGPKEPAWCGHPFFFGPPSLFLGVSIAEPAWVCVRSILCAVLSSSPCPQKPRSWLGGPGGQ